MKRSVLVVTFLLVGLAVPVPAQTSQWRQLGGDHFMIEYVTQTDYVQDVLRKAEEYYREIALDLGYPRYDSFWTWDNRVKIKIYPDRASFLKATNQPEWSHGMADYTNKEIVSYAWGGGFIESLLPHEMAHLIFRDFVGFKGEVPLWLDEGVSQRAEKLRRQQMRGLVRQYYDSDNMLTIEDMMKLDIRKLDLPDGVYFQKTRTKTGDPGVMLIGKEKLVEIYYLQSFALVDFLIEKYGSESFAAFCRELRDGKDVRGALRSAYPYIESLQDFETRWRKYIENNL